MASSKSFDEVAAFPDNIPVANLPRVSLSKLLAGSADNDVYEACHKLGFFLLDLRDEELGEKLIVEIDNLFALAKSTFDQDEEEKLRYASKPPKDLLGYKARGVLKTEEGKPDRHECYSIAIDDVLGNEPPREKIDPVEQQMPLLESYCNHCRLILNHILQALSKQLSLDADALQALHPTKEPSGTTIRLFKYGASVSEEDMRTSLIPHTDWGSVTLLANVAGGLQILEPGFDSVDQAGWKWVKPEPGCLIVNMGDAMVEWTAGVLRSNMHRVRNSPGQQRYADRYSAALLFRGHKKAPMTRLVGGHIPTIQDDELDGGDTGLGKIDIPAYDWEVKKAMAMIQGKEIAQSRGGRELRSIA